MGPDCGCMRGNDVGQRCLAAALACALALSAGCVSRELAITSDPEGASVLINDTYRGTTPMEHPFTHYQIFRIRLEKEGYHPLAVEEEVSAPLYERPGIDFVSEALLPVKFHDRRELHYELEKITGVDPVDEVLANAKTARERSLEAVARREAREREPVLPAVPLPLKEGAEEAEESEEDPEAEPPPAEGAAPEPEPPLAPESDEDDASGSEAPSAGAGVEDLPIR